MKKFFLTTLVLICIIGLKAQSDVLDSMIEHEEINENAGEFLFETETHDYGVIIEGEKPEYAFKFKNVGNEPIIIKDVKPSCGCTTPDWPKKPIMPGESSEIRATYNSENRMGGFNKAIRIISNAKTPTKIIYIKGAVKIPGVDMEDLEPYNGPK